MPKPKTQKSLAQQVAANNKKMDQMLKKMNELEKDFKRFQLVNFLRFLIVTIPIIFAILYLIPLFREILQVTQPLLDLLNQFRGF